MITVDCIKLRQAFEDAKVLKKYPYDFALAMTHFYLNNKGLETPTGYSVPSSELKELIEKNEVLIHYILDEGKDFMEACEKVYGS
ncbi:archaeal protein [Acidianus two-tailed virus 2]|nr:archaeal protein [Acidianus two-tailed virus 2]